METFLGQHNHFDTQSTEYVQKFLMKEIKSKKHGDK